MQPENAELQQTFASLFGPESRVPEAARHDYKLQGREPSRPSKWHDALALGDSGKLGDTAKAFEEIGNGPKADALAWYNAGLLRAWQGDNVAAIADLDKYVERETNEAKAVDGPITSFIARCCNFATATPRLRCCTSGNKKAD